jgi:hypothetical protein
MNTNTKYFTFFLSTLILLATLAINNFALAAGTPGQWTATASMHTARYYYTATGSPI